MSTQSIIFSVAVLLIITAQIPLVLENRRLKKRCSELIQQRIDYLKSN